MLIDATHQDIIHDIAFNCYGNATASSDYKMRVYNKVNRKLENSTECKYHDGPLEKRRFMNLMKRQIKMEKKFIQLYLLGLKVLKYGRLKQTSISMKVFNMNGETKTNYYAY